MATNKLKDMSLGSKRRWVRRTNVYIAEYIIMLLLVSSFIGLLCSLWFSFFSMLHASSYLWTMGVVSQVAALVVVGPAAYWVYARVTGQEMIQPELRTRTSRTVFLTIWLVLAALTVVGMGVTVVTALLGSLFGVDGYFGEVLVTVVLPGVFSVVTIGFALAMIVKQTSRDFVRLCGVILTVTALVLLVANVTMALIGRSNAPIEIYDKSDSSMETECTLTRYLDNDCSYSDYQRDLDTETETPSFFDN